MDETGADGLVPVRSLGREFFHFDREAGTLMGSDTGLIIAIGQRVTVRLTAATPVTGGLELELLSIDDQALPRGRGPAKRGMRRKAVSTKRKKDKIKRKVERKRRQR